MGNRSLRCLGLIFTNCGKSNEEALNELRKTGKRQEYEVAKQMSLNTKKRILYTVRESILRYGLGNVNSGQKIKEKLLGTKLDFPTPKSKKINHQRKNGSKKKILYKMENNLLQWYGHVVGMEENRWPERIMTSLLTGRRRRNRWEVQWRAFNT